MKAISKIIAPLSLAATLIPPLLFVFKLMSLDSMKVVLLVATVAWFATAPFWLKGAEE